MQFKVTIGFPLFCKKNLVDPAALYLPLLSMSPLQLWILQSSVGS